MGKPILNEESGARTVAKKIAASAIREQKTFEVIDYDSLGDNYILLYKSIAIKHSQTFDQNSSGAGAGGYEAGARAGGRPEGTPTRVGAGSGPLLNGPHARRLLRP